MKKLNLFVLVVFFSTLTVAQIQNRKDQPFHTVRIGDQEWMAKNLKISQLSNGEPIPLASNAEEWMSYCEKRKPCYAYYSFDKRFADYGYVYNFYAAHHPKFAPEGWTVPKTSDWTELVFELGQFDEPTAVKLKHGSSWKLMSPQDNVSGFSAQANGYLRVCGSFTDNETLKYVSFWRIDKEDESGEKYACSFGVTERDGASDIYLSYAGVTAGSYIRLVRKVN